MKTSGQPSPPGRHRAGTRVDDAETRSGTLGVEFALQRGAASVAVSGLSSLRIVAASDDQAARVRDARVPTLIDLQARTWATLGDDAGASGEFGESVRWSIRTEVGRRARLVLLKAR